MKHHSPPINGEVAFIFFNQIRAKSICELDMRIKAVTRLASVAAFYSSHEVRMAALVVHASKDGESTRTLFASSVLAIAKARGLF
jgi:hypothetical protein